MNDLAIGRIARFLRLRLDLRQQDVAARTGVSQSLVSLVERGRLDRLPLWRLRRLFEAFDAEVVVTIRWRGGDLERLADRGHAALGESIAARLRAAGWEVRPEVSFSEFGERGSIDLLAWHPPTRTLLVIELKTEITSVEATLRMHDVKTRLAAKVARARFGWIPANIGRLLVLPDQRTSRRQVERHRTLFADSYPARNVAVRRWLKAPSGPLSGLLFVPSTRDVRGKRDQAGRKRVRQRSPRSDRGADGVGTGPGLA